MPKQGAGALDRVADRLYALPPHEFTEARDTEVRRLRADGDRDLARDVGALRKPTVTAWLANQLVRRHPDQVEPLLDLGAALREATATLSGPQLRELSRQRGELVQALVRQARRLAADSGQRVSEDAARGLEETLNAALADERAGEQLRGGRLTETLQHTGFGGVPSGAPPTAAAPPSGRGDRQTTSKEPSEKDRRRAERRAELERELADAWAVARAAADARSEAEAAADTAAKDAAQAQRTAERLRAELDRAEAELHAAQQAQDDADATRERVRADAEQATRKVSDLQQALDRT